MRYEATIPGMLSVHARRAVFTALAAVDGIERADVELGRAVVEHRGGAPSNEVTDALREAIAAAGFEVTDVRAVSRQLPTL